MKLINYKIVNRKGHPRVIFRFTPENVSWTQPSGLGWDRKVKQSYDENGNFLLEMPISMFPEFIGKNPDICGVFDVKYDPTSLRRYYGFWNSCGYTYSVNLTRGFLNDWVCRDCPDLVRFTANVDNKPNDFGISFIVFDDILFRWDYIDETVGELYPEEYEAFEEFFMFCRPLRVWNLIKEAWINQNSVEDIKAIHKEIEAYELKVQEEIDKVTEKLEKYSETLPEYALDCGFTMIYTTDEEIVGKIHLLKTKGVRATDSLRVKFPSDYFSVTNSREIFRKFKELAGSEVVDKLYVKTRLD